ncbi:phosphopantetheine-binding protein [Ruminococcus sp.]|uniref:acyl carrier protein n=1 Tax=Ruminococcus sp. TaxID=41978 RepID=UPI0025EEA9D3|nr:phosphopantetheine-binding protein [Ruminococcus sp.]MBO4523358.1 acyl carrier protein [Ruminococcus sp.]
MFNELKEMIMSYVSVSEDEIKEEARFAEDLGFNSYDFMCMLGDIEDTLDVEINESEAAGKKTVGSLVEYLEGLC